MEANLTEVGKLLLALGRELGRSAEQMQPIIRRVVEDSWYESVASLRDLKDDEWSALALPGRLLNLLKKAVEESDAAPLVVTTTLSSDLGINASETIASLIASFRVDQREESKQAIQTLAVLIRGVLFTPSDEGKRLIRKANPIFHERVGKHPGALAVLNAIGFEEDTDCMNLHLKVASISCLTDAYRLLEIEATSIGFRIPPLPSCKGSEMAVFNPFVSSISRSSADVTSSLPTGSIAAKRNLDCDVLSDQLEAHRNRLKHAGEGVVIPLQASVMFLSDIAKTGQQRMAAEEEDEPLLDDRDDASGADLIHLKQTLADAPQFRSRAKDELQRLSKQTAFEKTVIRVLFPDKVVLQMNFSSADTIEHVTRQILNFLRPEYRSINWFLYESPPIRRLLSPNKTLYEERLAPAARLHWGFDKDKYGNLESPYLIHSPSEYVG